MVTKIITLTKNEYKNLQLIEKYNNLIYDTECKLFELNGGIEVDVRCLTEYNYTVDTILDLSDNEISYEKAKQISDVINEFETNIEKISKQIRLQVFKGAMHEMALDYIDEWERIPNSFPLNN